MRRLAYGRMLDGRRVWVGQQYVPSCLVQPSRAAMRQAERHGSLLLVGVISPVSVSQPGASQVNT